MNFKHDKKAIQLQSEGPRETIPQRLYTSGRLAQKFSPLVTRKVEIKAIMSDVLHPVGWL